MWKYINVGLAYSSFMNENQTEGTVQSTVSNSELYFNTTTRLNTIQSNDARNPKKPKETLKNTKES